MTKELIEKIENDINNLVWVRETKFNEQIADCFPAELRPEYIGVTPFDSVLAPTFEIQQLTVNYEKEKRRFKVTIDQKNHESVYLISFQDQLTLHVGVLSEGDYISVPWGEGGYYKIHRVLGNFEGVTLLSHEEYFKWRHLLEKFYQDDWQDIILQSYSKMDSNKVTIKHCLYKFDVITDPTRIHYLLIYNIADYPAEAINNIFIECSQMERIHNDFLIDMLLPENDFYYKLEQVKSNLLEIEKILKGEKKKKD